MVKNTVAIFGSAFNPPHLGHADVISQASEWASKIIVVPSYAHAFGKSMAPYDQRFAMTKALLTNIKSRKRIIISDIEKRLAEQKNNNEPIYTYDVMCALSAVYRNADLRFVVGPDNAAPDKWEAFYRADEILERWGVWAAKERVNIRSTTIRASFAQGKLPSTDVCPQDIISLVKQYGLYTKETL